MKIYKAVIFDLDGTLLNTLDDLADAVNYALMKQGYSLRKVDEIRSFVGNGVRRLIELSVPPNISEEDFENAFELFKNYYAEHSRVKTKPYPEICSTLYTLKARGYKLGIVSNKSDPVVKELRDFYFKSYIDIAVGETSQIRKKPAPDSLLNVISNLNLLKDEILYVGDSEIDWQTSLNAGVDCVLVDWGFRSRDELLKLNPSLIISSPSDLLKIV